MELWEYYSHLRGEFRLLIDLEKCDSVRIRVPVTCTKERYGAGGKYAVMGLEHNPCQMDKIFQDQYVSVAADALIAAVEP